MSDSALKRNKLVLNRETLVPLQDDQLQAVNGGTGLVCSAVRSAIWTYRIYRSVQATRQLTGGGGGGGGQQAE